VRVFLLPRAAESFPRAPDEPDTSALGVCRGRARARPASKEVGRMASIQTSIIVNVPASVAYNQWTQFETFPEFMEGVERVEQLDDKRLHWVAEIAGVRREWDAEIVEQIPNKRIAWRSIGGEQNAGAVSFEPLSDERTRVTLQMEYDPDDFIEKVADTLGFITRRVEGDLERFKEFIESRGIETGAWRGRIEGGRRV
jgi:uncharacterized membrane protein